MRVILWIEKGGMGFKGVVCGGGVKTTLKKCVYKIKLKFLNTYNTYNSAKSRVKIGTVKVFYNWQKSCLAFGPKELHCNIGLPEERAYAHSHFQ